MDEENKSLIESSEDITHQLVSETDPDKTKRLISLFNLNVAKKNAVRLDGINVLIDDVLSKIGDRLALRPDEFSNKDLIDYLSALQTAAEKSGKIVSGVDDIPAITVNQQNNVIVGVADTLTKESKQRIAEAVALLLNKTNTEGEEIKEDEEGRNDG